MPARSGQSPVQGASSQPAVGLGFYLCRDMGRVRLCGVRHRRARGAPHAITYPAISEGRTRMKSWLWQGVLAAAIALPAASSMARAESCTNATLKGDYA